MTEVETTSVGYSGEDVEDATEMLKKLVPKFGDSCVKMKNPSDVLKKIKKMVDGGFENLQVISDFDYTISRFHQDGKRALNCHDVVRENPEVPEELRQKSYSIRNKYYPIEVCHEMTVEEKIPHILQWYKEGFEVWLEAGLSVEMIKKMVKHAHVALRCGTPDMFAFLKQHCVPVLVFSAGLGDVIEEILEVQDLVAPNVHLISNRFVFDEETGKVTARKGDVIHMFNKNESAAAHSSYFEDLTHRHNVVLMGDSTGDSTMADGVVNPNVVFRIGFLNDKIEERLPLFLDTFDVVLLDDQTMELPNQIFKAMGDLKE